jgi:hypothetical protein
MRTLALTSVLLLTLCAVGCSKPSIDGKWNVAGMQQVPAGSTVTMDLNGGNYTSDMSITQMGANIKIKASGTYTFDGKQLTMVNKDIVLDEASMPAQLKAFIPQAKAEFQKEKGKSMTGDVTIDGDKVTVAFKEGPMTLTKVK